MAPYTEAQACGTPVVGARGALPEVVRHNETGILVSEPAPRKLASAIIQLLKDDDMRKRLGNEGVKWAHDIGSYETLSQDWENIAKRAIEDVPAPSGRLVMGDVLRMLGYGRLRICANALLRGKQTI